jgi:glucokinase
MIHHIAVDIGGTQMRAASYCADCLEPTALDRVRTQSGSGSPVDRLMALIAKVWPSDDQVAAISVAAPGPVNPYEGIVLAAPNIHGWTDLPLRALLTERFQVPVSVGNDANLAALGEWHFGAGQGHHHLIYLTVSTGIGGGVIVNDQLLLGWRGLAAELGHVTVMQDGPACGCGQFGHLEALASGPSIVRWMQAELRAGAASSLADQPKLDAKLISEAAQAGDLLAQQAIQRAGMFIGQALANYLHIFNPSIIIIGGGVGRSGPLLFDPLMASMRKHIMTPDYLTELTVVPAALGDEAGLMGALAAARTLRPA